tara:strand:+ start:205 stop:777 length:573 start_codon:yes stop_codon:yes gene_type:complete
MFGLFKRKKPYEQEAALLVGTISMQSRRLEFYEEFEVPDTTEGRFDLLLVHLFLLISRIKDEPGGDVLAQSVFDTAFLNIDEGYREIGISDMGVPKRMKKLMLAFNGRMHAYSEAIKAGLPELEKALDRNIYNIVNIQNGAVLPSLAEYILANKDYLEKQSREHIFSGHIEFKEPVLIKEGEERKHATSQ